MAYPRLLSLDHDTRLRLESYLRDEVTKHIAERRDAIQSLMDQQKDYWAQPSNEVRIFPFRGASNVVIPLNAIATEAVHARQLTTLFAIKPFWSVSVHSKQFSDTEHILENYMDHIMVDNMNLRQKLDDALLENTKFGTAIGKADYERLVKKAVRFGPSGEREEFDVVVADNATLDIVPLHNFVMPHQEQNPQTASWCGEIHSLSPFHVLNLEKSGLFEEGTFEKLQVHFQEINREGTGTERSFTAQQEELEKAEPVWPNLIDFWEIWLSFDVDKDEKPEEIVVWYHFNSGSIPAIRYNWYEDLHRPYRKVNYIPVEHRWRGIGVCKQSGQFQREVTTIHRQRLDNATIANMRMFKVSNMSDYGPDEPIFPGKMWFVDDMDHIDSVQIGEVYQSSFANEQSSLIYQQQRSGVNEVTLGMPTVGTPGTATGDIARIQEGNKKFDYTMANIKDWLSDLAMDVFLNVRQFGPRNPEYFRVVGGERIIEIMQQNVRLLRDKVIFSIVPVGQQRNRVVDRQEAQEIAALLEKYYSSLALIAQNLGNAELMQVILIGAMRGTREVMRQLMQTYDHRNIERILIPELEAFLSNGQNSGLPQGLIAPGSQESEVSGGQQGLGILQNIARAAQNPGNPQSSQG